MLTVPVTLTAFDQKGNPVALARVRAQLDQTEIYNGFVVPEQVDAVADSNGVCVLNLWPNALGVAGSLYTLQAWNPDTGKKFLDTTISVPNSACNVHEILAQEPYPAVDASQQALVAAQGALALVTTQAGIATAQAGISTTQAGIATTQATAASTQATAAAASAQAANTSKDTAVTSAATATTQAATATTQAGAASAASATATTQAGIATTQAGLATSNGATQVSLATTQAGNASTSASNAAASAVTAAGHVTTTSGNASAANASAIAAATQANNAATSATSAETQANNSANYAIASGSSANASQAAATSTAGSVAAAAASAAIASDKADQTVANAAIATTQANLATTNGAAQVTLATAQVALATTQANTATAQAGVATTQAAAALVSAGSASASAATSTAQAGIATAANVNSAAATLAASTATAQANISAASAAQASSARDLAIAAWAAATYPQETLAAKSQSLHVGTVVKAIVYDTSKDSDGGAWRKRCAGKSWFTETLGGDRWIGQQATIAAAWTAAGSATGATFQASATAGPLTLGKFYAATSVTTATEVFRGITREFPAVAGIVAESGRVVIYDLSNGAMWMAFTGNKMVDIQGGGVNSLAFINGRLYQGSLYLTSIDFLLDKAWMYYANNIIRSNNNVAARNSTQTSAWGAASGNSVLTTTNDIALTVLDNAPIDPATGLPVPTIAVATAGGVSVIKQDGTVVNSAGIGNAKSITITQDKKVSWVDSASSVLRISSVSIPQLTASFSEGAYANMASIPSLPGSLYGAGGNPLISTPTIRAIATGSTVSSGAVDALAVLKENPATPAKGMVAYITPTYNTGWMPGDIRLATLADTVAETITASGELVTNGTFTADTAGWTTGNSATIASTASELSITNSGATNGFASQAFTTVVGKSYTASCTARVGTSTTANLYAGTVAGNSSLGFTSTTSGTNVNLTLTFIATGASTYVSALNGSVSGGQSTYDNISVKLAEPDRSVKNSGLIVNGTLTKAPVAVGSALVAYSGFSATNYLEQPYNSNLDFGTGDFCVMGWINLSYIGTSFTSALFSRALSGGTGGLYAVVGTTGTVTVYGSASTSFVLLLATTAVLSVNIPTLICVRRLSSVLYIDFNGVNVSSVADTTNLTYANTVTRLGVRSDAANSIQGSLVLWRISATAPSADQISQIYRDELPLFQPGAQCTLAGTSAAVTALAYDDVTDLLQVGTATHRSAFKGLLRTESEATPAGAITSIAASGGTLITGGASGYLYQPAIKLRDEMARKAEARKALGKVPVFFDYTATASQTAFVVPKGYTIKALYKAGTLMRETTSGVYWTRSNDGYQETATLSVAASVSDWISIMCVRA